MRSRSGRFLWVSATCSRIFSCSNKLCSLAVRCSERETGKDRRSNIGRCKCGQLGWPTLVTSSSRWAYTFVHYSQQYIAMNHVLRLNVLSPKGKSFRGKSTLFWRQPNFITTQCLRKPLWQKNSQIHPAVSIKHLTFDRQTDRHRHRVIANTAVAWHYGGENWLNSEFRTRTIRKYPYFSIYRLC